jgi:queuine tRNA-ribosyltransferase
MLAGTLATIHNLHFIIHMVDEMRQNLLDGDFTAYKKAFLTKYYGK